MDAYHAGLPFQELGDMLYDIIITQGDKKAKNDPRFIELVCRRKFADFMLLDRFDGKVHWIHPKEREPAKVEPEIIYTSCEKMK